MSSHHIVREKQEPALLVLGLDNFPDELLGQLLEWAPTVIATIETAEKLTTSGIKIDWIITNGIKEVLQADVKLVAMGERNLIGAALEYLCANEYTAVNIITDELNLEDYEGFADKINLVIFYSQLKIYPVMPGFSKWKPANEVIKILNGLNNINVTGLNNINGQYYKTTNDGLFTLNFNSPFLFIAEEL